MEVENNVAFYSRLVANGALIQLLACFLLASRSDPYAVAPLIALYSTRESDRRAMMLYFVVTCIAGAFELIYLLRGGPDGVWVTLGVLLEFGIKLGMLFPAMKLHDLLPEKRAPRVEPAQLQAQMAAVVQQVLSEHLERLKTRPATVQRPPAVTPEDGADGSWDTV
jgi:peptidoglycan/LPS O-acetylase OafA/YrhL